MAGPIVTPRNWRCVRLASHGGKYAYNIRGSNFPRRANPLDGPRGHLGQRRLLGGESGALSPVQFREELCRVKPVQNRREEGRRPPFSVNAGSCRALFLLRFPCFLIIISYLYYIYI